MITYTNGGTVAPAQVAKDLRLILDWITEHGSIFDCDCRAYQESDTGAWIHEEDKCSAFMEDHVDIVLRSLLAHFDGTAPEPTPQLTGDLEF